MTSASWLIHQAGMKPPVEFVRQVLDSLDASEAEFDMDEWGAEEAAEARARDESQWKDAPEYEMAQRRKIALAELREQYLVVLPLNARYAALISTVAGMEWLVRFLDAAHRRNAVEFVRKGGGWTEADAGGLRNVERLIRESPNESAAEILGRFAGGKQSPEWGVFRDLCAVRNAVTHCAGCVGDARKPKPLRAAAERLRGVHIKRSVEVEGKEKGVPSYDFQMPMRREQVWIERDALRPLVEQTLRFLEGVHEAHFGPSGADGNAPASGAN